MAREARLSEDDQAMANRLVRKRGCGTYVFGALLVAALAGGGYAAYKYVGKYEVMRADRDGLQYRAQLERERLAAADHRATEAEAASARARTEFEARRGEVERQMAALTQERDRLRAGAGNARPELPDAEAVATSMRAVVAEAGGDARGGEGRVTVTLPEATLFRAGDAALTPQGGTLLRQLVETLRGAPAVQLEVRAHADATPARDPRRFPTAWELTAAQAVAVVRHLMDSAHVDAGRVAAAGYGASRPGPDPARARRVEIVVTRAEGPRPAEATTPAPSAPDAGAR